MNTIGVIAPYAQSGGQGGGVYHYDYTLKLGPQKRQLTLRRIHDLIKANYDLAQIPKDDGMTYDQLYIPPAAYYLEGLLRANGYQTIVESSADAAALSRLAKASPQFVLLSTTMLIDWR